MATHKQSYLNSCGAASLLCAANELGVTTIPRNRNYSLWRGGSVPLQLTQDCETRLYQVTSCHPRGGDPRAWGYSMPSGIAKCARILGLRVKVIAYRTWTVRGLKLSYKNEIQALKAMNVLQEHGSSKSAFKPNPRQKELKVLRGKGGALHYVMLRNDGTVMDPGTGVDLSAADYKTRLQMHGTGLSVFLQN